MGQVDNGFLAMFHQGQTQIQIDGQLGVAQAKVNGIETVNRMKAMPCDDDCFGPGTIRQDGRKLHPAYLLEVKKPEESKHQYDYYKVLGVTPPGEAFRPLAEGGCAFVRA